MKLLCLWGLVERVGLGRFGGGSGAAKVGCKRAFVGKAAVCGVVGGMLGVLSGLGSVRAAVVADFQLLTWNDAQATVELPTAVGRKPSASAPSTSDWLAFTADDQTLDAGYNAQGALSHNLADITGAGGSPFNMAPSLAGSISLTFTAAGAGVWDIAVGELAYSGQATPAMFMNQYLVTPDSAVAQDGGYNVDGLGNSGTWQGSDAGGWEIQYNLDFYFATNADGNPAAGDVDATFNNKSQQGYLLPVSLLTTEGLAGLSLNDPAGYYSGDFADYLLEEIAPRLPGNATYLLLTQMGKVNPDFTEVGLPVTTSSLIGNTTIAYTTSAVPEPSTALMVTAGLLWLPFRRRSRRTAQEGGK